ncbi:MAG: HAMP domain-containing histidine kinase [Elusimicrobia bacterium]|nr:HAMP domain-containing histidine kinase [Elusimicrobiota bacterium]
MALSSPRPASAFESSSPNFRNETVTVVSVQESTAPVKKTAAQPALPPSRPPARPAAGARANSAATATEPAAMPPAPVPPPPAPSPRAGRLAWALGAAVLALSGVVGWLALRARPSSDSERMAMVAHELKSPLSAIESYLDLMAHEGAKPGSTQQARAWLEDVHQMKSTAAHLRLTIADLLEMTQIESGKMKLAVRPTDLAALARDVGDAYKAQFAASKLSFKLVAASGLPKAAADPDRIRQVINNLLSNAIKFTPEKGPIAMTVRLIDGELRCSVRDSGAGMSAAESKKLFGKFVRLRPSVSGQEGTGLGLFISKAIVEAHRGRIWCESEPGKGSEFHFTLPAAGA